MLGGISMGVTFCIWGTDIYIFQGYGDGCRHRRSTELQLDVQLVAVNFNLSDSLCSFVLKKKKKSKKTCALSSKYE